MSQLKKLKLTLSLSRILDFEFTKENPIEDTTLLLLNLRQYYFKNGFSPDTEIGFCDFAKVEGASNALRYIALSKKVCCSSDDLLKSVTSMAREFALNVSIAVKERFPVASNDNRFKALLESAMNAHEYDCDTSRRKFYVEYAKYTQMSEPRLSAVDNLKKNNGVTWHKCVVPVTVYSSIKSVDHSFHHLMGSMSEKDALVLIEKYFDKV